MAETGNESEGAYAIKWDKPKVLLIDLPKNLEVALEAKGYNASAGTLGQPYYVEMTGGYSPLLATARLPNYTEQEVIFIDLSVPDATNSPEGTLDTSEDQYTCWVQHTSSSVDPRPQSMLVAQSAFDRTLGHGGIIVVFSLPRNTNTFVWARKKYGGIDIESPLTMDNWSFSSLFDARNIGISADTGMELVPDKGQNPVSAFFRRHAAQMQYRTTFAPHPLAEWSGRFSFHSLIKTKFGDAAGGVIIDEESKGMVFLLPQCSDHQKKCVVIDLLQVVLPEIAQRLFPHLEGGRWVESSPYEHSSVLKLKSQQEVIKSESELKIATLEEQIQTERERNGYLHGILTKKSAPLVKDVKMALENFGFTKVIDADEEQGQTDVMQEDLQIHDKSPTLLIEVKGLSGFPREGDTIQVVKYIPRRMKEWNRTDVSGMVIINHQCNLPALQRDHESVFTAQQCEDSEHQDVTLVTTWELFRLLRGKQRWNWPDEAVAKLFYGKGRIDQAPTNYHRIGVVAHFYDQAGVVSIEIDEGEVLRAGDTIGFILRDQYFQEVIESMEVNRTAVEEAAGGQRCGHKTSLPRRFLPNGLTVYVVS